MQKISANQCDNKKKLCISITGYRTLLVFLSLLEKPRTINELINILEKDIITNKSVSKDTIRITLNTLKSFGCELTRPAKSNGYKYTLINHPFNLTLTPEDVDAMILIRERLADELSWKKVIILNTLYNKFISLTNNSEYIEKIESTKPLNDINEKILLEISNPKIIGKKVNLTYNSPEYNLEDIVIIPQKIIYENSKLYLQCYNYKYKKIAVLNISRIIKINSISINNETVQQDYYEVEYEVWGTAKNSFNPEKDEKIIKKTDDKICIKAVVLNEFLFIQRLFLLGPEFRINSPDFFKEKLANKIRQIRKGYINE